MYKESLPQLDQSPYQRQVRTHSLSRVDSTVGDVNKIFILPASLPQDNLAKTAKTLQLVKRFSTKMSKSNTIPEGVAVFRKHVVSYFKLHLNMCSSIGSILFCWNKENNEFGTLKQKGRRNQFYFQMTIHVVHNIFLLWSLLSRDMGRFGVSYKMLSIYFAAGYCLCNGLRLFAWLHDKEIVKLVNAQFQLQERIRGKTINFILKIRSTLEFLKLWQM